MWWSSLLLSLALSGSPVSPPAPAPVYEEDAAAANEALQYLNSLRAQPQQVTNLGIPLCQPQPLPSLRPHPVLMEVARQKALDMVRRNYFAHQTPEGIGINCMLHENGYLLPMLWRDECHENNFESLAAGLPTGKSAVQALIVDAGVPSAYHRKHLLGLTDFYRGCTDVGICFVRASNTTFKTYCVIIVARQE